MRQDTNNRGNRQTSPSKEDRTPQEGDMAGEGEPATPVKDQAEEVEEAEGRGITVFVTPT